MSSVLRGVLGALLAGAVFSSAAIAATTGSVTLGGSVSSTLSIVSTATAAATALPLDGAAAGVQQFVKVSDLAISTNNEQGVTLRATYGSLTKLNGSTIDFLVTAVADGAAVPAFVAFPPAATNFDASISSIAGAANQDLYIVYTPAALQDPGAYAGSIALTVFDN